jgi:hypothetical protein
MNLRRIVGFKVEEILKKPEIGAHKWFTEPCLHPTHSDGAHTKI